MGHIRGQASAVLLSPSRVQRVSFGAGKEMKGPRLAWHSPALNWLRLLQPLALHGAVQKCLWLPDAVYVCLYAAGYHLDLSVCHHTRTAICLRS